MKTTYRHVGITTKIADWTDEEVAAALSLLQGWKQPNAPEDVPALRARAAELSAMGYDHFPPCADADDFGNGPGHEDELIVRHPTQSFKIRL